MSEVEWMALWISLKVSVTAVLINLPIAVLVGYFLARSQWKGKTIVETIVYLPLVMPPVVTGYLLLVALGRNGFIGSFLHNTLGIQVAFTWMGATLAAAVISFPLMVRSTRLAFQNVDPRFESAAKSLGASGLDTFFTISLPLALHGLFAACVLGFARSLGEFGATIMFAGNIANQTQTIPLAIYSLVQRPEGIEQSWRLVALSILIAMVALFVSEWMEQRGRRHERV